MALTPREKQRNWRELNERVIQVYEDLTGIEREIIRGIIKTYERIKNEKE